jgi:hypothetical protein
LTSTATTSAGSIWPFRNSSKLGRDGIRDEHHPHAPRLQVRLGRLPELLRVEGLPQERPELLGCIHAFERARRLKPGADGLHRPVHDRVGRVVQHLTDHLAPDAGVAAALDLDQGRDGVLVQEQVVHVPAIGATFLGRHGRLARDEQPAPRRREVHLITGQG